MEPFRVICETCHARLKVSSASAIGEIHACPKCGSMVEIRPPVDGTAPPPSTIGGASIEIGAAVMPTFDDFAMATSEVAIPTAAATPAVPLAATASGPPKWLMWGIGGGSILVAGGLAAVMLLGSHESPPTPAIPIAKTPSDSAATSEPASIATEPLPATDTEAKPAEAPVAAPEPPPSENVAEAKPAGPKSDLSPTPPPASTETAPVGKSVVSQSPTPAAPSTDATRVSESTGEKPRPKPVMSFDPLDFDPSQFSFGAGDATPAASEASSIPKNAEVVANDDATVPAPEKAPEPVAPKVDRSLTMRLGPMPDGNAPPHRLAEQLGARVESFAVADMPLGRFVDTVCDLADVAVTLDPIELELAGVTPRQTVGIDSKDVTVEKVLRDVLAKQRLELVERDGQFGIALAGGEKRKEVTYDLADLAGTEDATSIANLVQRFVAPNSWTEAGGGGSIKVEKSTIRVEQSQRIRHEVHIFCERLRLARGLSQRSRYPASLLATVSPYAAAAPALEQRATFTFLPWTRLGDVVRHWQDASKLTILVDWRALAEMDLGPSSPVACSAIDRTWEDALDGILEPVGLAWWPVNGETIQVTSREALDKIQRIEFYAVPKTLRDQFESGDALVESLQQELAELGAKAGDKPQPLTMELDEPSGRLIVLGTPASHRFLTQRLGNDVKQVASQRSTN